MRAEAIVVGAGPAGSAAAITLARAGVNVVLVERSKLPRDKACGDGLSPRAVELLKGLGVSIGDQLEINRLVLRSYEGPFQGTQFDCATPWHAFRRINLDQRIAEVAVRAGATLLNPATAESLIVESGAVKGIRVRSELGRVAELRAPVTVLAEGSVATLLRQAPVKRPLGQQTAFAIRTYFENVKWEDDPAFEILIPIESAGTPLVGYAWVFPVGDSTANVGVGWLPDRTLPARLGCFLTDLEDRLLRHDRRFSHARRAARALGAPLLIGSSASGSFAPGLLLAGDAAGLKNPFSAEGVSKALESGVLAGEAIVAWLEARAPLSEYARLLTERRLVHDPLVAGLPSVYRILRHVSRDLVSFVGTRSAISAACFAQGEFEFCKGPRTLGECLNSSSIELLVAEAKERVRRLVYTDRAVFGAVLGEIDRDPRNRFPCVEALVTARAALPAFDARSRALRRAAVCLELARYAAILLDDLEVDLDQPAVDGSRGGGWIASTLAITLADRLLARSFSINAKLTGRDRHVVATAIVRIMEKLTDTAARCVPRFDRVMPRVVAAEAARAGALIGGATTEFADVLSLEVASVASRVRLDDFARTCLSRFDWGAHSLEASV